MFCCPYRKHIPGILDVGRLCTLGWNPEDLRRIETIAPLPMNLQPIGQDCGGFHDIKLEKRIVTYSRNLDTCQLIENVDNKFISSLSTCQEGINQLCEALAYKTVF